MADTRSSIGDELMQLGIAVKGSGELEDLLSDLDDIAERLARLQEGEDDSET